MEGMHISERRFSRIDRVLEALQNRQQRPRQPKAEKAPLSSSSSSSSSEDELNTHAGVPTKEESVRSLEQNAATMVAMAEMAKLRVKSVGTSIPSKARYPRNGLEAVTDLVADPPRASSMRPAHVFRRRAHRAA